MTKKFQNISLKNFPAVFDLNTLDGINGFRIPGLMPGDHLGWAVAVGGDINGDNKTDFVLRTTRVNNTGEAYVIFGASEFTNPFDLNTLNGTNGFTVPGLMEQSIPNSNTLSLSGDINGDGKTDLILGAPIISPGGKSQAGEAYVIFGSESRFNSTFDLNMLNGKNGFRISGLAAGDDLGWSVSIGGDINVDGIDDLVLGACYADPGGKPYAGEIYVIFGSRSSFLPTFDLRTLNGNNGFVIPGLVEISYLGSGAAIGNDINGDGKDDLILGASGFPASSGIGEGYVIFGTASGFPPSFNLNVLNGTNGFTVPGIIVEGHLGWTATVGGDINGDVKASIVFGAPTAESNAGEVYVIFGSDSFPNPFNISALNGINGFRIPGLMAGDYLGISVAAGGDLNEDDKADLILGAYSVSPNGKSKAGEVYVIFGSQSPFSNLFNLTNLDGKNGFRIPGLVAGDHLGSSVAISDINGDGRSDIILGAEFVTPGNISEAGEVYVIFANNFMNYGMLSYIDQFHSINSTDSTGMVNIGSAGQWCNAQSLHVGDFNGDRSSDLICNMNAQNSVMLAKRAGYDVTFVPIDGDPDGKTKIGTNDKWCDNSYQELLTGDFNADNKSDLLCRSIQGSDAGQNYVMLSNGTGFNPMASSSDGKVKVGELGKFCANSSRLITGDFNGNGADDLLCNTYEPLAGSMIMIPNGTDFISINADVFGRISMGTKTECYVDWCQEVGSVLKAGDFNADGKDDLLCNYQGKNMIMLSSIETSWLCDFKPITSNGKTSSDGYLPIGQNQQWCDTSKFKLLVEDVNGDQMADVVCNERGSNYIMLCGSDGADGYQFKSINSTNPNGQVYMGDHSKWCLSQNLLGGDYNGDTLGDLLCNQGGQVADNLNYGL